MAIIFSAKSRRDLAEIGDYIAKDSSRQADLQVTRIENACLSLSSKAQRFPVVRHLDGKPLRRVVVNSYSIFYLTEGRQVLILRILHAARDVDQLLSPGA